ncbi:MAG: hypothetical protein KDB26_05725 [Microthrixaceae bacterium]|nr:hypothetical protein [Microthrixaceae bacterium]
MTLVDPPTRVVWAVDVLASIVSVARVIENADGTPVDRPRISAVEPPPPVVQHCPRTTWERASDVADKVFDMVTMGGTVKPTLVVMSKQVWGALNPPPRIAKDRAERMAEKTAEQTKLRRQGKFDEAKAVRMRRGSSVQTDPTAQRRLQVHAMIEDRLHRAGIPVAEFPFPTALSWLRDGEVAKKGDDEKVSPMAALDAAVAARWGIVPPPMKIPTTELVNGKKQPGKVIERDSTFRPGVAALAAVGAMSVGIETDVPVTETRLRIARAEHNRAAQFPSNRLCPLGLDSWLELNRRPEMLTV